MARGTADEKPEWQKFCILKITPGLYRMRNGHTAKVERKVDLPYTDQKGKLQIFPIWKGVCVECSDPHTWNLNGSYSPVGKNGFDLLVRV